MRNMQAKRCSFEEHLVYDNEQLQDPAEISDL